MNAHSVRLDEICDIRSGGTPSRAKSSYYGGSIPWAKISDIERSNGFLTNTDETLTESGLAAIRGRVFEAGTLLFAIYGSIGKMAFAGRALTSNQAILGLSFRNQQRCYPRYVYHWLLANNDRFLSDGQGIAQKNLSAGYLRELKVPLPALDEQKRIAAILDKADALRSKRKRVSGLLDGLTQSIFMEMFGDPVSNPKRLRKAALGEIIKVKSGEGLVSKDMASGGVYAVYGGNGINGRHDEFMFDEPKIVIGRVGVYCGAVHITEQKSWITDNALYVSDTKREMSQAYLATALRMANFNQYAGRAAQPLISGSRIYPIEILIPDISAQMCFARALEHQAKVTLDFESAERQTDRLFSSLQHRAFTGQL